MAKKKVTEIAEELLTDYLAEEGLELYHSEFVKEGSDWFLRIYIDRLPDEEGNEQYISTDDCEKVSRFLSEAMDEADPIQQNYYLEVSSPGMDRPLLKPQHWQRYIGHPVEIRLYRGKDGTKNITGILEAFHGDPDEEPGKKTGAAAGGEGGEEASPEEPAVTVTDENGRQWTLAISEIARARLAVVF